jgi:hypothetical protein
MTQTLTTAKSVIDALGGVHVVRELSGQARVNRVYDWAANNRFPSNLHASMTALLALQGLSAPPSLWHQKPIPEKTPTSL